jgi:3-methyladenine DNA glycosylase AlkD
LSPAPGSALLRRVRADLRAVADPARAPAQQAYMKSDMPYHGVTTPDMRQVARAVINTLPVETVDAFIDTVRGLWNGATHREERYVALEVLNARRFAKLRTAAAAPKLEALYQELLLAGPPPRGMWWDLVDSFAPARLAELQAVAPARAIALLRRWAKHDDIWLRRAAILSQMKRKADTDPALLAEIIAASFDHPEFFVRKAIGWALREYAYLQPDWVRNFVATHADRLSPLTRREALKHVGEKATGDTAAQPTRGTKRPRRAPTKR